MFLEHNSNIVLEFVDIIMLYKHNVSGAYFVLGQIVVQMIIDNDSFQNGNRISSIKCPTLRPQEQTPHRLYLGQPNERAHYLAWRGA